MNKSLRTDTGQLFENYIISEYIKANHNNKKHAKYYFGEAFSNKK